MHREPGYYWVKINDYSDWSPAEWHEDGHYWATIGYDGPVDDDEIFQVGDKFERPQ